MKRIKDYGSYDEYLKHQASKLDEKRRKIKKYDKVYEKQLISRYTGDRAMFDGKSMLCLGARLGGEVRAFLKVGCGHALGVDVNPGDDNEYVVYGDFHNLDFGDSSFNLLFTNCIDHVYDLDKFLEETTRVLSSDGVFIIELIASVPNKFEVIDCSKVEQIVSEIEKYYTVELWKNGITNYPTGKKKGNVYKCTR